MNSNNTSAYPFVRLDESEMIHKSKSIKDEFQKRRTIREFSEEKIPFVVIENCLLAAGSAPSGANKQPWKFVVVTEELIKSKIRYTAEIVEEDFYKNKAPQEWKEALAPLDTNSSKPFLEEAHVLIVIFEEKYAIEDDGMKSKNYYTHESVGIATGMLISALHRCGLASLTYTPSPMSFLNKILNRPENERPFLLLAVGYPKQGAKVPAITRKSFHEIAVVK